MKNLFAVTVGIVPLLVTGAALAQDGSMMSGGMGSGGWMGGWMGGYWLPLLLVVVVGLVAWVIMQRRK